MLGGCAVMMRVTAVESERRGHSQASDVLVDTEQLQFATQHSTSMVGECRHHALIVMNLHTARPCGDAPALCHMQELTDSY